MAVGKKVGGHQAKPLLQNKNNGPGDGMGTGLGPDIPLPDDIPAEPAGSGNSDSGRQASGEVQTGKEPEIIGESPPKNEPLALGRMFRLGLSLISGMPLLYTFLLVVSLGGMATAVFQPTVLGDIIKLLGSGEVLGTIGRLTGLFAILVAANILFNYLTHVLNTRFTARLQTRVQQRLHDAMLKLGNDYHDANGLGKTSTVMTRFSSGAVVLVLQLFLNPVTSLATLVLSMRLLLREISNVSGIPGGLVAGLLLLIVLFPFISYFLSNALKRMAVIQNSAIVDVQEEFTNTATQPMLLQLMRARNQRNRAFSKVLAVQEKAIVRAGRLSGLDRIIDTSLGMILQLLFIVVVLLTSSETSSAALSGAIVVFIMLIPQALSPMQQLIGLYTALNVNWPMISEVLDVLERRPAIRGGDRAVAETPLLKSKDLTFAYPGTETLLLRDLNLEIPAGQKVGILAASGSGKSTLFKLLTRQYDGYTGEVSLGGTDLRDLEIDGLRRDVVLIPQFPYFVSGTVRENFQLVREDAGDSEILALSEQTGLLEILLRLNGGRRDRLLDLPIDRETGGRWSGGERKILSLTRTLLLNPKILLIDEQVTGLSPLDARRVLSVMENVLQLEQLAGDTVIAVEHNPAYLGRFCDTIICLENGRVAEQGSPEELLAAKGLFHRMYHSMDTGEED